MTQGDGDHYSLSCSLFNPVLQQIRSEFCFFGPLDPDPDCAFLDIWIRIRIVVCGPLDPDPDCGFWTSGSGSGL